MFGAGALPPFEQNGSVIDTIPFAPSSVWAHSHISRPNQTPLTTPQSVLSVGVRVGPSPTAATGPPRGGVRLEILDSVLGVLKPLTTAILSLQCVVLHGSKCESAMTTISRMSKSQLTFLGKLGVLKLLQANMHLSKKTSLGTSRQVYASLV